MTPRGILFDPASRRCELFGTKGRPQKPRAYGARLYLKKRRCLYRPMLQMQQMTQNFQPTDRQPEESLGIEGEA